MTRRPRTVAHVQQDAHDLALEMLQVTAGRDITLDRMLHTLAVMVATVIYFEAEGDEDKATQLFNIMGAHAAGLYEAYGAAFRALDRTEAAH